jgi:hypothetical protein
MLVCPVRTDAGRGALAASQRRRGAILPWFIVCGPVLILALTLVLFATTHRHRQEELKEALECAALAGANYLVDEELLTDEPNFGLVHERAREAVLRFGQLNRVDGEPLELDANFDNSPRGEVLFGRLPHAFCRDLDTRIDVPGLDVVRVVAERGHVRAAATAWVDRDVIGFRPQGCRPLPVEPLAILSDPFSPAGSLTAECWEAAIEARLGSHEWKIDPETKKPRKCKPGECDDRIPEITLCFHTDGNCGNARALWLGGQRSEDLARQTWEGVAREDLAECGSELCLPADGPLMLPRLKLTKSDLEMLAEALAGLRDTGERRIWMLYSPRFDATGKDGVKAAGVLGFVAAQVLDVQLHKDRLCVVLQPGMRITETALTDHQRRGKGPRPIWNPYVCRVRLVE